MSTRLEMLCRGVSRAAWAYFFLYFDFNLGTLNILPDFLCYVLLWQAIGLLEEEERDLALLRPLCLLLGIWAGGEFLLKLLGWNLTLPLLRPLTLVLQVAALYFHFQIFTDFARMAQQYQQEGQNLDRRFLRLRAIQAILTTVVTGAVYLLPRPEGWGEGLIIVLAAASMVVALMLMLALFALRRNLARF